MKFSESWLREWVNPDLSTQELAHKLSMAGLEVDAIHAVAGKFDGVIAAKILQCTPHPDADRLQVCQVDRGQGQPLQIVCGAPNARPGIIVPLAQVGAYLPNDFRIESRKLRGIASEGMLCSGKELGLNDTGQGLLELPEESIIGEDLNTLLKTQDVSIELDLTPNRGDCLSVRGVARETSVLCSLPMKPPKVNRVKPQIDDKLKINLHAPQACPSYVGRIIKGVRCDGESPLWLQEKLRRSGLRPLNPIVDVTNLLLLELGQPMHAFDLDKLSGEIHVRMAQAGEKCLLLDDNEYELQADSLVIADNDAVVALAGIMGGSATAVTSDTQDIFLESAYFSPLAVAGKGRKYGIHTDSSHRFERGVDWQLQEMAIERATEIIMQIAGGQPGPTLIEKQSGHLPKAAKITLRASQVNKVLGITLEDEKIESICRNLGFDISRSGEGTWQVVAPSYRHDINIEVDIIEELARIHGYDNIPSAATPTVIAIKGNREEVTSPDAIADLLIHRGFKETINYSFVDEKTSRQLDPENPLLFLANPLSAEMSVMRNSLWTGLVHSASHNLRRQQARVQIFEIGLIFQPSGDDIKQEQVVSGLVAGKAYPEQWNNPKEKMNFYHLKGHIQALLGLTGRLEDFIFKPRQHPALHSGQSAEISLDGQTVGTMGRLDPTLQRKLGFDDDIFVFELAMWVFDQCRVPKFSEYSKFPLVRRDLALLIDETVSAQQVLDVVNKQLGQNISALNIFDVYQGKNMPKGKKSIAVGITLQDLERTLTDSEVESLQADLISTLEREIGATLRE